MQRFLPFPPLHVVYHYRGYFFSNFQFPVSLRTHSSSRAILLPVDTLIFNSLVAIFLNLCP